MSLTASARLEGRTAGAGQPRRGFALPTTLLAVILIGAILAALFFAVTEETRTASAVARRDYALSAAESVIEAGLDDLRRNDPDSIVIGASLARSMKVEGAPAVLYTTRLDSGLFWLVAAMGDARDPWAPPRRVGALVSAVRPSVVSTTIVRVRGWSELF